MLILGTTGSLLQVTTSAAGTVRSSASWVDDLTTGPTFTPGGATNAVITTAMTAPLVAAPATNTQRNVRRCSVSNTDASVSQTITVTQTDGTNTDIIWKGVVLAGERIAFDETGYWTLLGADGVQKASYGTGQLIKVTVLTTGTSFNTQANTRSLRLVLVGGGGAGGGCTSVATAAAAAGGGGAGGYGEVAAVPVTPLTSYTYAIGAAGVGASGAAGGNGGATTFTVGGVTYTAQAGQGAPVATAIGSSSAYKGGNASAQSTSCDINGAGAPGEMGVVAVFGTPQGASGTGGTGNYGAGGAGIIAVGNGNTGTGYGAGGSGGFTGASAVRTGGNGTAGVIYVYEYS